MIFPIKSICRWRSLKNTQICSPKKSVRTLSKPAMSMSKAAGFSTSEDTDDSRTSITSYISVVSNGWNDASFAMPSTQKAGKLRSNYHRLSYLCAPLTLQMESKVDLRPYHSFESVRFNDQLCGVCYHHD